MTKLADAKSCCSWASCQQIRVSGFRLCQPHIDTSRKLNLTVQTYDESLNDTPDLGGKPMCWQDDVS